MKKAKTEIDRICAYLESLHMTEERFEKALSATNNVYMRHLAQLGNLVILTGKTDWNEFTDSEKLMTENTDPTGSSPLTDVQSPARSLQWLHYRRSIELNQVDIEFGNQ